MAKTALKDLDRAVEEALDAFAGLCIIDIREAAETAAKEAAKELKRTSPRGKNKKKSGQYAKGWKVNKEETHGGTRTTVYNKDFFMLTHLLEYGHAKATGGRTPPIVHIQPVETKAAANFEAELKRRIEDGT